MKPNPASYPNHASQSRSGPRLQDALMAIADAIGVNQAKHPFSGRKDQSIDPGLSDNLPDSNPVQDAIDRHLERMRKREQANSDMRAEEFMA
jgi:hypothetical protein